MKIGSHALSPPHRLAALLVIGLTLRAFPLDAQAPSGSILGRVQVDGESALDVSVTVEHVQRDVVVCRTWTDRAGAFRCLDLSPGTYRAVFEKPGLDRQVVQQVVVSSGGRTEIQPELSTTALHVEELVLDHSPLVDARATRLAYLSTSELLQELPTERSLHALVATMPGVESGNNYGVFQPGAVEVQNVLGAGERANSYLLDGANTTDAAGQWNVLGYLPTDAVEEIQVVKGAKPAEVPFQGGLISVVTRSGSDQLSARGRRREFATTICRTRPGIVRPRRGGTRSTRSPKPARLSEVRWCANTSGPSRRRSVRTAPRRSEGSP